MREIVRPGIILFIITVVAGLCLGMVYQVTEGPIAEQKVAQTNASMQKLLSSADNFEELEAETEGIESLAIGYEESGEKAGYVIGVATKGYGGTLELLVAVNTEGNVEGVDIVNHSETPGLGANAVNPSFLNQYTGTPGPFSVTKTGSAGDNDIQAITSATITSNAVTDGVNRALEFYKNELKGGQ